MKSTIPETTVLYPIAKCLNSTMDLKKSLDGVLEILSDRLGMDAR